MNRLNRLLFFMCLLSPGIVLTSPVAAQDWAKTKLAASPRHREYVTVKHDGRSVTTYVAYPEVKGKAPVVVLIHEIFGLTDWMKLQADELAAKGYIVLVPDLLTGVGPNGGGSDALYASPGGQEAVIKAVMGLAQTQVDADLDAVANYGKGLPSAGTKFAVAGFCWGGGKSFAFSTHRHDLNAAFVFYGGAPPASDMAKITAPVYGFYAGQDGRIGETLPQTVKDMQAAGKSYEPVTYDGAGHGFMRLGQDPAGTPENKKAFDESFARLIAKLHEMK